MSPARRFLPAALPALVPALLLACTPTTTGEGLDDDAGWDSGAPDGADSGDADGGGSDSGAPGGLALADEMDIDALLAHLDALQAIADAQADTRAVGTPGYEESADYIAAQLEAAGYTVTWQEFTQQTFVELSPPTLESPDVPVADSDFQTMSYSGAGTVTDAPVIPVDVVLPPGAENSSTSGCETGDFAGFPAGAIALIQRGTCTFGTKAGNAQAAGAAGVIIFNEGQSGRRGVVEGTLGDDERIGIPVVGATFDLGEALAEAHDAGGATASLTVDVINEDAPTWNLLADLPGDPDRIVVVGAHLDSVTAGPGINDNGSGTALVLELALQAAALDLAPANTLRFAFWGAEEVGLVGSYEYVEQLSADELDQHVANLNFDMVASPNGGRFIYDGDESEGLAGFPAPDGSGWLESLFTGWLDAEGLSWEATAFDGRSDYGPFIWAGIPAGGLFTGAEGIHGGSDPDDWGGESGTAYDPCYHRDCDTADNIDPVLYLEMARAAAHATELTAAAGVDTLADRSAGFAGPAPRLHHALGDADLQHIGGCQHQSWR